MFSFSFFLKIQIYGFNKELYNNMSEAQYKSQGIVGLSLMVQIGDTLDPELRIITTTFNKVLYKGKFFFHFSLSLYLSNKVLHTVLFYEYA